MSNRENKKIRRRMRYERNVKKEITHKNEAWTEGKLLEENHNGGPYSKNYTMALTDRLMLYISQGWDGESYEKYLKNFRKYKQKVITLILHWSPEVPKTYPGYEELKNLLEIYWDKVVGENDITALPILIPYTTNINAHEITLR